MNDLGTALRGLAGGVEAPNAADPVDLWARGRTRVVRRRIAAVVAVIVLGALGYVGVARPTPTVVMPAGTPHAAAIPENVWAPNKFLAGVSKTGAPGKLAMIAATNNDDTHYYGRWFGISATTGRYVALKLPGEASDAPMWLSPDGYHIAYGITGPTRKKSYGPPTGADAGGPLPEHPEVGLGVYDTRDGSVLRYRTLTDFGWSDDPEEQNLSWTDDRTVIFTYSVAMGANTAHFGTTWLWHLGVDQPTELAGVGDDGAPTYLSTYQSGILTRSYDGKSPYTLVDTDGRPTGRTIPVPAGGVVPRGVSVSGDLVAYAGASGPGNVQRVQVGHQPGGKGPIRYTPIGTSLVDVLLGWRSADTVLVAGQEGEVEDGSLGLKFNDDTNGPGSSPPAMLYTVNLIAKKEHRLGIIDEKVDDYTLQVASSLVGHPLVHGRRPPSLARALLWPYGFVGGVVVASLACLVYRRRRPWHEYLARTQERYGRP